MTQNTQPTISSIFIPVSVLRNLSKAKTKIDKAGLVAHEHELLTTLFTVATEKLDTLSALDDAVVLEMPVISSAMQNLGQKGSTQRAITAKCKRLTDAGFFRCTDGVRDPKRGGRLPLYFILEPIHKDDFEPEDSRELRERAQGHKISRAKTTQATLKFLKESDAQLISHMRDIKPVTETIFTGLLDKAMRFSTKERPENNRISTKFRVKSVDILVMATTATGPSSELAALSDQRVIRALLSEIVDWIDKTIVDYILHVERPRQSSLFDDDEDAVDIFASDFDIPTDDPTSQPSEVLDDGHHDADMDLKTRAEQQRDALEQAATDRIRNSFVIDVVNIAKRMGYKNPHSTSSRRFINQSLRRLHDTNFRLVIRSQKAGDEITIMKMFGLQDIATDFRFLTELKSQYDEAFLSDDGSENPHEDGGGPMPVSMDSTDVAQVERSVDPYANAELERVRFWRLSLDTMLFAKLLQPEERKLFVAHSEIMKEQSGLGQTLYNLFTSTLGRRNRGPNEAPFITTLPRLHNTLWATRRYARFQDDFFDLMKRYMPKGSWDSSLEYNKARMFGYVFELRQTHYEKNNRKAKMLELTVSRDRDDPLSGDDSYFNKKITGRLTRYTQAFEDDSDDIVTTSPHKTPSDELDELKALPWFSRLEPSSQKRVIAKYPNLRTQDKKVLKAHGLASPYIREVLGFKL